MSRFKRHVGGIALSGLLLLAGCPSSSRSPHPNGSSGVRPIGLQLQQQDDSLQDQRFRRLLDFESASDQVFARSDGRLSLRDEGHTGASSLAFDGSSATLRIGSVLFGAKLPGDWTLLGCYVKPSADMMFEIAATDGQRTLATATQPAAAGRWTFVSLDLTTPQGQSIVGGDSLALRLTPQSGGRMSDVLVDDVILIDNSRTLLDTLSRGGVGWKISRRGHSTTIDAPGRFKIDLLAAAASQKGWVLREHGPMRVVLAGSGDVKTWILYNDGRWIEDGRMSVKGASREEALASHQAPATIEIDEAAGRLNRSTEGDTDNDGYNERLGAYQIVARQPRVAVGIRPGSAAVVSPVLEIFGLPPGDVSVMTEGRLIETHDRLPDGRVLVTLPIRIDRPVSVSVKVTAR